MADQLQLRGGTTNEHSTFTGALREVTVDTDKDTLIVHDAATAGGHPLLREDGSNSALSLGTAGTPSIKFTGDTNTGIYSPGADQVAISTGGSGRLFVDASGQVGINNASPSSYLGGSRNLVIGEGSAAAGLTIRSSTSSDGFFAFADGTTGNEAYRGYIAYGHSTDHLRFATSGTERLRIDSSGRLLVGTSTARANFVGASETTKFQVEGAVNISSVRTDNTAYPSWLIFGKTRSTGNTVVQSGDELGRIAFEGNDGSEFVDAAFISAYVDGTPGANDMPGRLVFSTTADGASSPTNRMTIDSSGRVGVGTTSPAAKLHIQDAAANAAKLRLGFDSTRYYDIFRGSTTNSGLLNFYGSQTGFTGYVFDGVDGERLRIDSSGRVGVGTSSPQNKLTVDTDIGIYRSSSDPTLNFSVGGTISSPTKTYRLLIDDSDSDKFQLRDGSTARLTVDGSGNVGVGTTSPGYLLDVKKTDNTTYTAPNFVNNPVARLHNDSTTTNSFASLVFRTASADNALGFIYNGTTNQADFVIANDGGVNGEERFRITADGKVGIGTSTVSQKLHIADASNPVVRLTSHSGSQNCQVDLSSVRSDTTTSKAQFRIATDNGSGPQFAMVVDESQRVGIGTTAAQSKLTIGNGASTNDGLSITFTGDNSTLAKFYADTATGQVLIGGTAASYYPVFYSANSEKARIDTSGRLLVGTSSNIFSQKFQVATTDGQAAEFSRFNTNGGAPELNLISSRNATIGSHTIKQDGDSLGRIWFRGSDGSNFLAAASISAVVDGTPGTSDMPGRLVFSTTADGASSPTERMYIYNEGNVYIASSSGTYTNLTLKNGPSAANSTDYFQCRDSSNTLKLVIEPDGDVKNTNNSYAAISDVKLKENIVDAGSQWEDIKALRVRNYNFKASTGHGTHKQIGVIAQELELVSPGLVQESIDTGDGPDGEHEVDLGTTTKSVNYSVLYMKAVKALQEAMERIETLEAKVAALEAN